MSGYHSYKAFSNSGTNSEEHLVTLVQDACRHPAGSPQRQKNLTQIIRFIKNKLWKENTPYYQDALQQTWLYFCQNICEGNTGNPYDPNRSSISGWLNFYLKRRLQDFYLNSKQERLKRVSTPIDGLNSGEANHSVNFVENLPAKPEVPPLLEEVTRWVETDPDGELQHIHIKNHPEVTCQIIILRRLPPETSWKALSQEFNLPISTLSGFYQRQCLPCLRQFAESQGYLDG